MRILGLETSCDETACALWDSADGLISHRIFSQEKIHAPYGGVVPELASRDHIRRLIFLVHETLQGEEIPDAVAFTRGPGLAGALMVGATLAASLGYAWRKRLVGTHHLEGHLLSPFLGGEFDFPYLALLASGGHTQIWRADGYRRYQLLGETLDDAAGEALDKIAVLLGFGYPGGAALEKAATNGNADNFSLPNPMADSMDFSFSGLKTAVRRRWENLIARNEGGEKNRADLAASAQKAVMESLAMKILRAAKESGLRRIAVVGGVSRNRLLRKILLESADSRNFQLVFPPPEFCTDNAAMIALAGGWEIASKKTESPENYGFDVKPRWRLESLVA